MCSTQLYWLIFMYHNSCFKLFSLHHQVKKINFWHTTSKGQMKNMDEREVPLQYLYLPNNAIENVILKKSQFHPAYH